jgi:segregation and condensation protein B
LDYKQTKSIIEGLLFVSGEEGINAKQIAEIIEIDVRLARDLVEDLQADYVNNGRGMQISEVAGAFQLTTVPAHAPYFEKLVNNPSRSQLSQAALETLAIVAYRQPITRIDIEEVRGVKSDRSIYTLVHKDLIEEVGRAEAIGRPILYGTTKAFLEYFGLRSIKDLPDTSTFESGLRLEEETRLLFSKFDDGQLSFDDVSDSVKK